MIYLAPIQGFTDFIYRKAYSKIFMDVDTYFIPYVSVKNNQILKKYEQEILLQNNPQKQVIPQVLVKDEGEMLYLSKTIQDFGYTEINLNLGCPYPMVTNRKKGAGLLPHPDKVKVLLNTFFQKSNLKLSIKLRAGLNSIEEIESILPILNEFPLTEVILHPRIAKQLYKGRIYESVFHLAQKTLNHRLVYNGDIFCFSDFTEYNNKFTGNKDWMLGRGILMNPFLPAEIKNIHLSENEKWEKLKEFHLLIFEGYSEKMDNEGNVLNKMKQFWSYFSYNFQNQKKIFKGIKKSRNITSFNQETNKAFLSLY